MCLHSLFYTLVFSLEWLLNADLNWINSFKILCRKLNVTNGRIRLISLCKTKAAILLTSFIVKVSQVLGKPD